MIRTARKIKDYRETVAEIARMASQYKGDLEPWQDYTIGQFYRLVHLLPYVRDPFREETLSRPLYTMVWDSQTPRDCDDKTILIGAFCELKGLPWRIVVCGRQIGVPHHVYPEILMGGEWWPADATYPNRGGAGGNASTGRPTGPFSA